jgi:hypothetical protein
MQKKKLGRKSLFDKKNCPKQKIVNFGWNFIATNFNILYPNPQKIYFGKFFKKSKN